MKCYEYFHPLITGTALLIEVESCGATWTNFRGINWVNLVPGFAGSLRQATASPDITWEVDLYRIKRVPTPFARQPLHFWFVPAPQVMLHWNLHSSTLPASQKLSFQAWLALNRPMAGNVAPGFITPQFFRTGTIFSRNYVIYKYMYHYFFWAIWWLVLHIRFQQMPSGTQTWQRKNPIIFLWQAPSGDFSPSHVWWRVPSLRKWYQGPGGPGGPGAAEKWESFSYVQICCHIFPYTLWLWLAVRHSIDGP